MSSPHCPTLSTVSIVVLAVGVVLILVSMVPWIIFFVKRRKDQQKLRPVAPRVTDGCNDASGEYIDFQDDRYESMNNFQRSKPAPKKVPTSKSKDAMEETFDGSRMPKTIAPKPPNHPPNRPPKSLVTSVKMNDGLTESGNNVYEDCSPDDTDDRKGGNVMNKLAGRISRTIGRTNDIRKGMTASGIHRSSAKRKTMF